MADRQFHAKEHTDADARPTHEVFKVAPKPDGEFQSRFASSGKYTTEQLEAGEDQVGGLQPGKRAVADDEPPADDGRSLYERLKEQRDTKQEEWETKNQFKNQMDHWKLDEDDAAWEEQRQARFASNAGP